MLRILLIPLGIILYSVSCLACYGLEETSFKNIQKSYQLGDFKQTDKLLRTALTEQGKSQYTSVEWLSLLDIAGELYSASGDMVAAEKYSLMQLTDNDSKLTESLSNRFKQNAWQRLATIALNQIDKQHYQQRTVRTRTASDCLEKALTIPSGQQVENPLWESRVLLRIAELLKPIDKKVSLQRTMSARINIEKWQADISRKMKNDTQSAQFEIITKEYETFYPTSLQLLAHAFFLEDLLQQAQDSLNHGLRQSMFKSEDARIPLIIQRAKYERLNHQPEKSLSSLAQAEKLCAASHPELLSEIMHERGEVSLTQQDQKSCESFWSAEATMLQALLNQDTVQHTVTDTATSQTLTYYKQSEYLQRLLTLQRRLNQWNLGINTAAKLRVQREKLLLQSDINILRSIASEDAFTAKSVTEASDFTHSKQSRTTAINNIIGVMEARLKDAVWLDNRLRPERFRTLSNLVELYRLQGDFSKAKSVIEEALKMEVESNAFLAEPELLPTKLETAVLHLNIGGINVGLGKINKAIQEFTHCQEQAKLALKDDQAISWKVRDVLSLATLNVAMCYRVQGDFESAYSIALQALKIRAESEPNAETIPFHLALAALALDRCQTTHTQKLIATAEKETLSHSAQGHLQQSKKLQLAFHDRLSDQTAIHFQLLSARLAIVQQQYGAANLELKELLTLSEKLNSDLHYIRGVALLLEVIIEQINQENSADKLAEFWKEAETYSRKGQQKLHQAHLFPNLSCQILLQRAQILLKPTAKIPTGKTNERLEALACLEQALEIAELPRATTIGSQEDRGLFYSHYSHIYDLLVDAYIDSDEMLKACAITEWRKNRSLRDQANQWKQEMILPGQQATSESLEQPSARHQQLLKEQTQVEETFSQTLNAARIELESFLDTAGEASLPNMRLQKIEEQVAVLRKQLLEIRSELFQETKGFRYTSNFLKVAEVHVAANGALNSLVNHETVALIYHIGKWRSHLFVILPNNSTTSEHYTIKHFELALQLPDSNLVQLNSSTVKQLVSQLLDNTDSSLTRGFVRRKQAENQLSFTDREGRAAILPDEVLGIVQSSQAKRVVVLADGPLHQIPLEMLVVSDHEYVLDVLPPLHYSPSVYFHQQFVQHFATNPAPASESSCHFVTVAPSFRGQIKDLLTTERYNLNEIPLIPMINVEEESAQLATLFSSLPRTTTSAFSERGLPVELSNIKKKLSEATFIHLAAHGYVQEDFHNLFGGLLLPPVGAKTVTSADFLTLYDIERLKLNRCELAILSACQTKCGTESPMESGSTLAQAFLAAGAKRVVASHWSVDDESTTALMVKYAEEITQQMREHKTVDYCGALYRAKCFVKSQKPEWNAPKHWAPFVLIGPALGQVD